MLQVSGNPIMRDVSAQGKYSRNLSLAQFVKAIGSLSGPLIMAFAARQYSASWKVLFPIYAAALLITIVAIVPLKVHERRDESHKPATFASTVRLLKHGYVLMMVLGIFLYVGAEVCVSSGIPLYLKERFDLDITKIGLLNTGVFFLALTIGRFSGGVILNWIKPRVFFLVTCVISLVGLLGLFVPNQRLAVASFFVIGLGFANIFPLIFSITVDHMPEQSNALSGLMVMAIVGGAIVPPIMGLVADNLKSVQLGFIVPLLCLVYISYTALAQKRTAVRATVAAK
jgi:fucose permease